MRFDRAWRDRRSPWRHRSEDEPFVHVPFWSAEAGDAELRLLDAGGRELRRLTIEAEKGVSSFTWDLLLDEELAPAAEEAALEGNEPAEEERPKRMETARPRGGVGGERRLIDQGQKGADSLGRGRPPGAPSLRHPRLLHAPGDDRRQRGRDRLRGHRARAAGAAEQAGAEDPRPGRLTLTPRPPLPATLHALPGRGGERRYDALPTPIPSRARQRRDHPYLPALGAGAGQGGEPLPLSTDRLARGR